MNIRRIVPDLPIQDAEASRTFYGQFLGLDLAMDMGWILTFAAPGQPQVQLTLLEPPPGDLPMPQVSMEVEDVDALHTRAVEMGLEIVYPLTEEPWGVKRFFVKDPNGVILNLMAHLPA